MKQLDLFRDGFKLTKVGLEIDGNPDFESWMDYLADLGRLDDVQQFAIGDAIIHGFDHYEHGKWDSVNKVLGHKYKQETLRKFEFVSKRIKSGSRLPDLSWTHHQEVAAIDDPIKQREWLELARDNNWTRATLRQKIKESSHITLIKGDMLEVLPQLGTFDLVVTDPPYGVTDWEWDQLETSKWLDAVIPCLEDEFNLFWFCSPKFAADIELIFRLKELPIQSRIVWHRRNMSMGSNAKKRFIDSWEMILHAGNRDLNFPDEWDESRFDVQTFAVPQTNFADKKLHPTQKPEKLMEWLVAFGSYPGDKILDPFAGAGTTGLVTPDDRKITLVEIEEGYIGITEGRLDIKRKS